MNSDTFCGYVYKITNILNNKSYVGQKFSPVFIDKYWGSGVYIRKAIKKYGLENFKREILCWCKTRDELDDRELYYIKQYNTLSPNGYNLTLNVFKSGRKQKHSTITKMKMSQTRLNYSDEKKKEILDKFHMTCENRTEEEKLIIHNNRSKAIRFSEKFQNTVHSEEYKEKQRQKSIVVMQNPEIRNKLSITSKENWKNEDYRNMCIKNLKHNDSEIQSKRSIKGNIIRKTNGFDQYNKSERAKEISKRNAEYMRELKNNMSEEEKYICSLKSKIKVLLRNEKLNKEEIMTLFEIIKNHEPTYDLYDSPKDRLLNKKFPKIKLVKKEIIELDKEIPVYDLTVDGNIPNFQLDAQVFVHNCPGGGKSRIMAFLTKQAVMAGKRVIFISCELDETETMANINSSITGLSMYDILKPENREEFIKRITNFKNTFGGNLKIKFYGPKTVNCDTIHNYIRKVMQEEKEKLNGIEWKPDFIVVDYMDNLLPIQKMKGSLYEDGGAVANDLKNLAISFDCPIVTGSQLGKFSWNIKEGDVISMDSIAESAAKVHLAHSMTTVNSNPGEKALGRARLFLAKSRSGSANSVVWVENDLPRCRLREIDEWSPKDVENEFGAFSVKSSNNNRK